MLHLLRSAGLALALSLILPAAASARYLKVVPPALGHHALPTGLAANLKGVYEGDLVWSWGEVGGHHVFTIEETTSSSGSVLFQGRMDHLSPHYDRDSVRVTGGVNLKTGRIWVRELDSPGGLSFTTGSYRGTVHRDGSITLVWRTSRRQLKGTIQYHRVADRSPAAP